MVADNGHNGSGTVLSMYYKYEDLEAHFVSLFVIVCILDSMSKVDIPKVVSQRLCVSLACEFIRGESA